MQQQNTRGRIAIKFKRAIAREWLLFLLLLFLSPAVVSLYRWAVADGVSEEIPDDRPRLYDLVVTAPGYDAQLLIDRDLPKSKRDGAILEFIAKHQLEEFTYTLSDTINPRTRKPYEIRSRQKLSSEDLESIKTQLAATNKENERLVGGSAPDWNLADSFIPDSPKVGLNQIGEFIEGNYLSSDDRKMLEGIKANGFLIFRRRPLLAYLVDTVKEPYSYFEAIIVVYPLFWFIRSIVWSVRNLRRRES